MTRQLCSITAQCSNKAIFLLRPRSLTWGHLNKVRAAGNWTNFWALTTTSRKTWVIGSASDTIRARRGATLTVCWGCRRKAMTWGSRRRTFMIETCCWNLSGHDTAIERSTRRQSWRHQHHHPMLWWRSSTTIRLAKRWNQTRTVHRSSCLKMPLKKSLMSHWP